MFTNDWGYDSTDGVCDLGTYNLPSTSCGQITKTLPIKGKEPSRYWQHTKGCREKKVNDQKTNPSPPRNGGKIIITFHDLCWLEQLELQ